SCLVLPQYVPLVDIATSIVTLLSLHDALPIFMLYVPATSMPLLNALSTPTRTSSVSFFAVRRSKRKKSPNRSLKTVTTPTHCTRSEEHTSELQSRENLVCRLLLEKKNLS